MPQKNKKEIVVLFFILVVAAILRFYNLMHDSPYFFNPDERNMANAISQFRLPSDISQIPICLISQISPNPATNCNLNPHFFAYGQFPLYLSFASDQLFKLPMSLISQIQPTTHNPQLITSFPAAVFWLRFWSALSSVLTVLFVYLIAKFLIPASPTGGHNSKFSILAALCAAFTPGLIQSAHFGTTESLLTFFFLASVYLSLRYLSHPSLTLGTSLKFVLLNSLVLGLASGSKLTGIFFFIPPLIALIILIIGVLTKRGKNKTPKLFVYWIIGLLAIIGSIAIFIVSSPYNLVDVSSFKSAVFGYESDVATGKYEAFYTRQFVNSAPILFQAEKIFPYALGWPVFILGILGFLLMNFRLIQYAILPILQRYQRSKIKYQRYNSKIKNLNIFNFLYVFLLFDFSFLIYFLPNAFLFAKWTRFMTPIFPFFAIFAVFALFFFRRLHLFRGATSLSYLLVIASIIPGIMFMSVYTNEDSRVQASRWIYRNIPNNSYILSETANVVDIPLGLPTTNNQPASPSSPRVEAGQGGLPINSYTVISFNFYNLNDDPTLFPQLLTHLTKADYILIPSRRIFANYTKLPAKYPLVTKYYQLLNSRALGFEKIAEINSYPAIGPVKFPDEQAEETFTVFDHPVVRIYQKVKPMTFEEYKNMLTLN